MGALQKDRRLLALWFPRLPTDRLKRHRTKTLNAPPLVVAEKVKGALRLCAVDEAASQLRLHVGQPLANARAMVPALEVVPASPHADAVLLSQMAEWCDRFTPVVALDAPDGLILDIAGAAHLFGDERALLDKIRKALKARGLNVQAAIAGSALAAHALARYRDGMIVAERAERDAVSPLPIEALQLDPVTTHAFRRAGLKTIGQVASRKRSEIVSRFGAATHARIDEALGQREMPISPRLPEPDYWTAKSFAEPVATQEVIQNALREIGAELCALMVQEGSGARRLEASFFRADGALRRIVVEAGAPVRDAAMIERLFRERLASLADPLDPGFGFDLIRLAALRVERMQVEAVPLDQAVRAAAEIDFLTDRLAARFGRERVLRIYPHETHVPEEAWVLLPAQQVYETKTQWRNIRAKVEAPRRPLRLLARPESVAIEHEPLRLQWRKAWRGLTLWEGPERIAMEWWRLEGSKIPRDYYRAEDEAGHRYWLYCELAQPAQWFMHGVFA
ncbi:Y-family DNA polymerase [Aestuariivirga litoralis]|uniref:Y-family DNA polymerase n=1 Tax=Aestuariivirga litoralis TaxID=2650924 RepID=UPI0018C7F151|nr:DNA polymerase Y family protein [Aestuariivirga litoralis]MBG1233596.1 DNA polymerase Y family protein [Aestuariivirga litoralis]